VKADITFLTINNGEFAWRRADLPAAISAVCRTGFAILGGEVWLVRGTTWTGLIPDRNSNVPGAWSWDTRGRHSGESWQAYCDRCAFESAGVTSKMRVEQQAAPEVVGDLWLNLTYIAAVEE
jgi:hypothetical protein